MTPASRLLLGGDDRSPSALDDGHDLGPLGRWDCELVERLRHIVHERVPLARRDAQVPVRALHVLAGVFLRTSGGPAQHLGNQVFKALRRYLVVRVVDQGIGVEPRISHHAVDEVVYDGRDAVDTAEPLIKAGRILRGHWHLRLLPHSGKANRYGAVLMVLGPLIRCHISPNDLKGTGFKNPLSTSASISVRCNSTRTEQSPLRRRGTKRRIRSAAVTGILAFVFMLTVTARFGPQPRLA